MQNNLNTELQNHRHPESSLRHSKSSLRHPESLFPVILSEIPVILSEIPVILSEAKDLFWSSSWTLHSLRSLRVTKEVRSLRVTKEEFKDGIKTMYEWYLNNQGVK
jgi:hypothetical protein